MKKFKKALAEKNAKFYIIDAVHLAREIGLGNRTNTILQSAFFKLNEQIMPYETAQDLMKKYAFKAYSKKGQAIVDLNYKAIDAGGDALVEVKVKSAWKKLEPEVVAVDQNRPEFVRNVCDPVNAVKGYDLPVSAFNGYEDGTLPAGTAAWEKRGIANFVPQWNSENCIQCNQCAFACPHAVVRPFLATEEEMANAPEGTIVLPAIGKGLEGLKYSIQISTLDCTGCEVCVNTCPGKKGAKALSMVNVNELHHAGTYKDSQYFFENVSYKSAYSIKVFVSTISVLDVFIKVAVFFIKLIFSFDIKFLVSSFKGILTFIISLSKFIFLSGFTNTIFCFPGL